MDKKKLRKQIIEKRVLLSDQEVSIKSKIISKKIENLTIFKDSENIAMYYPFKKEVNLLPLFNKYKLQKNFLFPKTLGKTMKFHKASSLDHFVKGNFGIMEPTEDRFENEIDMFLIPGVAFSPYLYRIGYGGGFYDRFIENINYKTILCGISFDLQVVDNLPIEKHDQRLDMIITNKEVYINES
ncbi:5-formyltetrahydrofolate cyclo-ligase [Geotoga petraea]|jgi:5-formyltetrahydrofolate cyclo-ligase|uniref:5-formyltetrahydrofolate cyclo-ligase n=1 Tax=Geotoga petraea TaxID=28234 RepID=A0A1G6IQ82_9BACT|nr:5-formyltetrahydrofolate cyclo-ligase [Geotoga petraea]MDK2945703.1 5-formyltetrahydrofolate cyclo-ligase [Geotoga sp.]TGG89271.1 5-formyltetrahydrofolate cyclo-ligase [Geotoga petraea]SDC08648.1 5-formyltetrahydrofolate cyclo-ligase [Geotoga petraea]